MKLIVLGVYALGLVLQLVGAAGVIRDVVESVRNMRKFKNDLATADAEADKHRRAMSGDRALGRLTEEDREKAVWQLGPAQAVQQRALVDYARAQDDISDARRWTAVGLLLLGAVAGFTGNALSLYIPAT